MLYLFKSGLSSNSLNSARSSISFFSCNPSLADDPSIQRLFRSFYRKRPIRARYIVYWPVSKVLKFLKNWHPISSLSLKQLTLKTIALIALSSSDRGQTLHLMDIERTHISNDGIEFVIKDRIKTTRRDLKPHIVKCIKTDDPALDVCDYTLAYMNRTLTLRAKAVEDGLPKPTKLFMSWASKKPVAKNTLARWIKEVLHLSDIDIKEYKAHSTRGASLSEAFERGATANEIVSAGQWSKFDTFKHFYFAPNDTSATAKIIMDTLNEEVRSSPTKQITCIIAYVTIYRQNSGFHTRTYH